MVGTRATATVTGPSNPNIGPMTSEKFHLKWDSHLPHLNNAVSSLLSNEKYADVMLFSSKDEEKASLEELESCGIPAHKAILSTSSQFFASIFDKTPKLTNGITCIILPSDLSLRAIRLLVEYIYTGEALVTNDIVKEVLKGGEILKIRGLFREPVPIIPPQQIKTTQSVITATTKSLLPPIDFSCINVPAESPVIVKLPKPRQPVVVANKPKSDISGIFINKEVAIDPAVSTTSSTCDEIVRNQFQSISNDLLALESSNRKRSSSDDVTQSPTKVRIGQRRTSLPQENNSNQRPVKHDLPLSITADYGSEREKCYSPIKEEPLDTEGSVEEFRSGDNSPLFGDFLKEVKREKSETPLPLEKQNIFEEFCILTNEISKRKSSFSDDGKSGKGNSPYFYPMQMKKIKNIEPMSDEESDSTGHYKPPTKDNKSKDVVAQLKCEGCHMSFDSPGEWVRHTQTEHTESELAMINNKHRRSRSPDNWDPFDFNPNIRCEIPYSSKTSSMMKSSSQQFKVLNLICEICKKKFSTISHLVHHRKKHHHSSGQAKFKKSSAA